MSSVAYCVRTVANHSALMARAQARTHILKLQVPSPKHVFKTIYSSFTDANRTIPVVVSAATVPAVIQAASSSLEFFRSPQTVANMLSLQRVPTRTTTATTTATLRSAMTFPSLPSISAVAPEHRLSVGTVASCSQHGSPEDSLPKSPDSLASSPGSCDLYAPLPPRSTTRSSPRHASAKASSLQRPQSVTVIPESPVPEPEILQFARPRSSAALPPSAKVAETSNARPRYMTPILTDTSQPSLFPTSSEPPNTRRSSSVRLEEDSTNVPEVPASFKETRTRSMPRAASMPAPASLRQSDGTFDEIPTASRTVELSQPAASGFEASSRTPASDSIKPYQRVAKQMVRVCILYL